MEIPSPTQKVLRIETDVYDCCCGNYTELNLSLQSSLKRVSLMAKNQVSLPRQRGPYRFYSGQFILETRVPCTCTNFISFSYHILNHFPNVNSQNLVNYHLLLMMYNGRFFLNPSYFCPVLSLAQVSIPLYRVTPMADTSVRVEPNLI